MPLRLMRRIAPSHIILFSTISLVTVGIMLLCLPIMQVKPLPFIDIVFTVISVATGTGLLTTSLHNFTPLGLTIITILMQIGALGLITLTLSLVYLTIDIERATELLAAQVMNIEIHKNIRKIIFFVMSLTAIIELLGAVCLFIPLHKEYGMINGCFLALFHSISAFSNAGLSLFPKSMSLYYHNGIILTTLCCLMLMGGIGFTTLREALKHIPELIRKKKYRFSLGSKIAWATTGVLLVCSVSLYWLLEKNHALGDIHPLTTIANAVFNGIASMGTGFTTIPAIQLQFATLIVIMVMAYIGTSPGSTGSGIKTTTIAIFFATVRAVIFGKPYVRIFGKRIARDQIHKAIAIISLSVPWIIFSTFLLLITEPGQRFIDIFFEAVSAFATLGISLGITPQLSAIGKLIIMMSMILGRIGPFTLIFALRKALIQEQSTAQQERVLLS